MRVWKEVEELYEVSNDGLVRRDNSLLKTRIDRYGYEIITLHVNGKALTRKVHRLVAIAFIQNDNLDLSVNHKDGNKLNNSVENLEWMSVGDNMRHGFATGLHKVGENRIAGRPVKLKDSDIPKIRQLIKDGYKNTEIGKLFGVSCGCIYSIRVGKSWTHIK